MPKKEMIDKILEIDNKMSPLDLAHKFNAIVILRPHLKEGKVDLLLKYTPTMEEFKRIVEERLRGTISKERHEEIAKQVHEAICQLAEIAGDKNILLDRRVGMLKSREKKLIKVAISILKMISNEQMGRLRQDNGGNHPLLLDFHKIS